ncbi:MAG: hypothetical protein ABIV50_08230 [Opitutus sp.]
MGSNTLFHASVGLLVAAHAAALIFLWFGPRTPTVLLSLNTVSAAVVIAYAATRLRYIIAAVDRQYIALFIFEVAVLISAIYALKGSRPALTLSYVGFGVHSLMVIGATILALTFKMRRLF